MRQARRQAIRERFDRGWSLTRLCRYYRHTRRTVKGSLTPKQLKRLETDYKQSQEPAVSAAQIMKHRAEGMTMVAIAERYGISRRRAYEMLYRAGIVLPPYHRVERKKKAE